MKSTQHLKILTVEKSDLNLFVFSCDLLRAFSLSRNHSRSFLSLCNQNKIRSNQIDRRLFNGRFGYTSLFTFRIEYEWYMVCTTKIWTNDNFSLRCTWGSSYYVRTAAFLLSTKWRMKKKTLMHTKLLECLLTYGFLFMYVRSFFLFFFFFSLSIYIFIHFVWQKNCRV